MESSDCYYCNETKAHLRDDQAVCDRCEIEKLKQSYQKLFFENERLNTKLEIAKNVLLQISQADSGDGVDEFAIQIRSALDALKRIEDMK